tara:strand:- start:109 stop:507 length:399 start_codon:yes stop_codon:yes gene_type:complete
MSLYEPRASQRSAPYWQGVADEQLLFQQCESCEHRWMVPREACAQCGGGASWRNATGAGTVYSYSVVRRAPTKDLRDKAPYVLALIDLAEGPRMMSWVIDTPVESVTIGMAVEVVFDAGPAGTLLPMFRPAR